MLLKEEQHYQDALLVEECQGGDPTAFDALVRRYKDRIYNVVYRFLGNHEDAQDVTQEVFIRAYKGIRSFKGSAKLYTWLYSIAGNLARNKLRHGRRRGRDKALSLDGLHEAAPALAQESLGTARTPEAAAREKEYESLLQTCIEQLPEHYRMVFILRTFDNLSYDEIADAMGCPAGTVKSRLNQARAQLHQKLRELGAL